MSVFDGCGRLVESVYSERTAVEADEYAIAYERELISIEPSPGRDDVRRQLPASLRDGSQVAPSQLGSQIRTMGKNRFNLGFIARPQLNDRPRSKGGEHGGQKGQLRSCYLG